jgi:predicted transcriptional regulator
MKYNPFMLKNFSFSEKKLRRLQANLKLFGVTQRDLAKTLHCHETYISNIFAGREQPKNKLAEIVKYLKNKIL